MALFNIAYVLGAGLYFQPTNLLRWSNILFALLGAVHFILFFLSFPTVLFQKPTRKAITITLYAVTLIAMGIMLYGFSLTGLFYNFSGHNWEGADRDLFRIFGFVILTYFAVMLSTGITRAITAKENRLATIFILIGVMIVTLLPGYFNLLSRQGLISRSTFQTYTVLMNIGGFFLAFIVYINASRDSTTFMGKIVTISLATILLALHTISFYWLDDKDRAYDQICIEESKLIRLGGPRGDSFRYWIKYANERWINAERKGIHDDINWGLVKTEVKNTIIWHKLAALTEVKFREKAIEIIDQSDSTFVGYKALILSVLNEKKITNGRQLLNKIAKLKQLEKLRKALLAIHKDFVPQAVKLLTNSHKSITSFTKAVNIEEFKNSKTPKLTLLNIVARFSQAGIRHYRGVTYIDNAQVPQHYAAFIYFDENTQEAGEVGFSYLSYRYFLAPVAFKLFVIILGVFLLIAIGFRFFFLGALIKPLDEVILGLKEVNKGNLNYRVPIFVKDEIGFLAKSFNRMARYIMAGQLRLQKYADSLEEKVKERTQELQQTLEEVQALKQRQDGDYFLTTLLLRPLGVNQAESEYFDIDFFIEQKKKFSFRHWHKDIGGDINIAHNIRLRGRNYLVVVNADAMGKSIQGAGGALVLGSVFLSIIERTKLVESMREQYPERWIKNVFIELHRIFESFDGSMLISLFLGLIDEESGLLYYINSEHPPAILLRDGEASFFEEDNLFRKLGTQGVRGSLQIDTFQMRLGDTIILGSDGRDDLLLETDEEGNRLMNEDETLILRVLAETKGDIHRVKEILEKTGEITDDLSLLRLTRKLQGEKVVTYDDDKADKILRQARAIRKTKSLDKAIAYLEANAGSFLEHSGYLKLMSRYYYESGAFENSVDAANVYLTKKPDDTEFVYFASWCFRKLKRYQDAIDLAERVRLRQPHFSQNLTHLAELNLKVGNIDRAKKLLNQLFRFDKHNSRGRKILDAIEKYQEKFF